MRPSSAPCDFFPASTCRSTGAPRAIPCCTFWKSGGRRRWRTVKPMQNCFRRLRLAQALSVATLERQPGEKRVGPLCGAGTAGRGQGEVLVDLGALAHHRHARLAREMDYHAVVREALHVESAKSELAGV